MRHESRETHLVGKFLCERLFRMFSATLAGGTKQHEQRLVVLWSYDDTVKCKSLKARGPAMTVRFAKAPSPSQAQTKRLSADTIGQSELETSNVFEELTGQVRSGSLFLDYKTSCGCLDFLSA